MIISPDINTVININSHILITISTHSNEILLFIIQFIISIGLSHYYILIHLIHIITDSTLIMRLYILVLHFVFHNSPHLYQFTSTSDDYTVFISTLHLHHMFIFQYFHFLWIMHYIIIIVIIDWLSYFAITAFTPTINPT